MRKAFLLALVGGLLSGCASVMSGTTDDVRIEPSRRADCTLMRGQEQVSFVRDAPGEARLPRTGDDLTVTCVAADGGFGRGELPAGFNAWALGNMLFIAPPAIIAALLIDGVTGAWHGYDDAEIKIR